MSESNGHTANGVESELANLRRQIDLETARHELHTLRLRGRLAESLYTGYSSTQWGELVDPLDSFRDADLRVTPLGTASRHDRRDGYNRPFVWAEIDLDFIRAQARWVSTKNPLGVGAVECLADYTVRTGFEYVPVPGRRFRRDGVAKELAAIAEDVIAEFTSLNVIGEGDCLTVWADREHESVGKAVTDGEAIIRTFDVGDGMTEARFVEPEQMRQPPGTGPEYSFGIHHAPGDVEKPVAYAVAYDLPEEWEEVPANEISHIKLNVPSCVKRGVSDYYSTADAFDGVNKLLRNLREAGAVQAAIAWIEEFDGATAGAVQSAVQSARDQNRPEFTRPFTGRSVDYQKYEPGTIQRITQGRKFIPSPSNANAGSHISVVQACLRALGARWKMPEAMISGDASNANFASSVIAGAPFVVRVECRQARFGRFFLRVIWQAIRNACKAGRFTVGGHRYSYAEVSHMIDITATPPKVAIADLAQEGVQDERDIRLGVMSLQTRRARRGLDDETERKNIKEEPPKIPGQQPQQSPFGQGQGGMGGGGEPSPFGGDAAPGALGESLAQLREEIRSLRESIEPPERIQIEAPDGTITEAVRRDRRGHRYCVDDGTGRRRACTPNELDEKTHTHQQVTSFIEKLKAGEVTADGVVQASRMMASLSVADLRQVNKALQAKAGGSRSHRAMVDAIKERVLGVAPGGEDERKAAAAKQLDKGQTPLPAGAKPAAAKPSVPQHQSKFPPDDKMRAYDDGQRAVHDALTAATVKAMADYPVDKYRIGVNDYVNDGHESINRHLRTGKGGAQNVELAVKEIDTAIAAAPPVPNGTVAYRGMRLPAAEHAEFAKKLAVGAVFSDSGFVSTSLDPGVAAEFMHASTEGILFEMLPRRGLYVGALGMKYFGDASNAEKELLLPRNVSYRVVAVKEIDVPSVADYKAKPAKKLTRRFGKSRDPLRVKVYQMEEVVDV